MPAFPLFGARRAATASGVDEAKSSFMNLNASSHLTAHISHPSATKATHGAGTAVQLGNTHIAEESYSPMSGVSTVAHMVLYGKPVEELYMDTATSDCFLLVKDPTCTALVKTMHRVPVHKEVLVLKSPDYFADIIHNPDWQLVQRAEIPKIHWDLDVTEALIHFLYRDWAEVPWNMLGRLRVLAEEAKMQVGFKTDAQLSSSFTLSPCIHEIGRRPHPMNTPPMQPHPCNRQQAWPPVTLHVPHASQLHVGSFYMSAITQSDTQCT